MSQKGLRPRTGISARLSHVTPASAYHSGSECSCPIRDYRGGGGTSDLPTPGTAGRSAPFPVNSVQSGSGNSKYGPIRTRTSCDVPQCDATLAANCSTRLLGTRACCSRLPRLRSRWWTLRCPEPRDGERIGPVPRSGRGWFIRPDANGSGVGRVSPSPRPRLRSGSRRPIPSPREGARVPTRVWLWDARRADDPPAPAVGLGAGGCGRRGACCNRDKSEASGCPRSNQTEKGLSFLWQEGEQEAPLSGQQSCLLVSACSERVGGNVWACENRSLDKR